ncbi:toxin CptA [Nitrosomonas sp. Nm84]|uniref:protein YgfX n=1 Tax=Nitrosomonas sp. Nm84 TaxID=200124 RepID=UPI000D75F241|nr:protein YgfX [Nitrosomonas sp. Nm84]PXW88193.1 toxin CptA [Nitrosomonas sp. Nm84]
MAVLSIQRTLSLRLAALLSLAHSAAAGLLWPLALPWGIKAMIMVALAISLVHYMRQDALLSANNAVIAFVLSNEMHCTLTTRSGESIICHLLGNTFVAPYLIVLNLKPVGKFFVRSVVILPDGIDAEEFRQLRVWLRWKWKDNSEIE